MTMDARKKADAARPKPARPGVSASMSLVEMEHLLKVAGSVSQDANQVWAEIWTEFRRLVTGNGTVVPEAKQGFVPECGWPDFLEKFWLLKHYLDSIQRICERKH